MGIEIGILSDSHLEDHHLEHPNYQKFFTKIKSLFKNVDHLIHAGDICSEKFLEDLVSIAPVTYCSGNCDRNERWPRKMKVTLDNVSIGIAHFPEHLSLFDPTDIRVFVHGHLHYPQIRETPEGVLIICPGSITEPRAHPTQYIFKENENLRPSVAFLTINDGIISAIIRKL